MVINNLVTGMSLQEGDKVHMSIWLTKLRITNEGFLLPYSLCFNTRDWGGAQNFETDPFVCMKFPQKKAFLHQNSDDTV